MRLPEDLPPDLALDLPHGPPLTFRLIPAGRFWMGQRGEYADEEPPHPVLIGRSYVDHLNAKTNDPRWVVLTGF